MTEQYDYSGVKTALSISFVIVFVMAMVCFVGGGFAWAKFGFSYSEVLLLALGVCCFIVGGYMMKKIGSMTI
jgi:uncharacterized membrane protein YwaF